MRCRAPCASLRDSFRPCCSLFQAVHPCCIHLALACVLRSQFPTNRSYDVLDTKWLEDSRAAGELMEPPAPRHYLHICSEVGRFQIFHKSNQIK